MDRAPRQAADISVDRRLLRGGVRDPILETKTQR